MADQLSPETAQMVADFQRRYPDFDLSTGFNPFGPLARNGASAQAARDFVVLRGRLAADGFQFDQNGSPRDKQLSWKRVLLAAAAVGAPIAAAYLMPAAGAAGAAGSGGVGIGETAAVTGLGGSGMAGSAGGIGATSVGANGAWIPAGAGATGTALTSRQTTPNAGTLPRGGTGLPPGAGNIPWGDVMKRLAEAGIPLAALATGRGLSGGDGAGNQTEIPQELKDLLAMSMKRMAYQEPLAKAVTDQALGGLPTYAKTGGS